MSASIDLEGGGDSKECFMNLLIRTANPLRCRVGIQKNPGMRQRCDAPSPRDTIACNAARSSSVSFTMNLTMAVLHILGQSYPMRFRKAGPAKSINRRLAA